MIERRTPRLAGMFDPVTASSYRRYIAAAGILALIAGCGSAGTFRNGVYQDRFVRYRIGLPVGRWQQLEAGDNDVAFHDRRLGTISANSTCTEYEDVPEQALLNHLLFGTRERVFRLEEIATLDGRGALHAVIDLQLDGVPLTLEVYVLKKDGCVYDLTYIASRTAFASGRPTFIRLVRGFHVIETNLSD